MDFKEATSIKWKTVTEESPFEVINVIFPNDIHLSIPKNEGNGDYVNLMKQVDAGDVTIEAAD